MRYRLTLTRTGLVDVLPINYASELSAWVYRTLHTANPVYAAFLRQQGYSSDERAGQGFRFFTFSTLEVRHFKLLRQEDSLQLFSEEVQLEVSFLSDEAAIYFARGLAQDPVLRIANGLQPILFQVRRMEGLTEPVFGKRMLYRTSSPLTVSVNRWHHGRLCQQYLAPTDPEFGPALARNLARKYEALTGKKIDVASIRFELLSEPKSRLVCLNVGTAAETKVRGFHADFALVAPPELHRIAWLAGLGEKNAQGFGCIRQLPADYELMRAALRDMHAEAPAAPAAKPAPTAYVPNRQVAAMAA